MTEILTIKKIRNKARAKKIKVCKVQEGMDRHKGDMTFIPYFQKNLRSFKRTKELI